MRSDKLVLTLLIISGFLASYALSPRDEELALIYLKDGRLELAEPLYVNIFQEDSSSRTNLFSLKKIYLEQGEVEQAIRVFEKYVEHKPDDIEVLEQLAMLYKDSHQQYQYMRMLEKLAKKNPSIEQMEELLDLYVVYERKEDILAILKLLVEHDSSRDKEYQQLISLQASLGDYEGAEDSLTAYFLTVNSIPSVYIEMRLRLLILTNRLDKAMAWITSGELAHDQLTSIYYAASGKGYEELSLDVARHIHERFKNPADMELLAQTLFKQGKVREVVALLKSNENPELANLYEHSLMQAWKKDARLTDEVVNIWQQRLKSPTLTKAEHRQLAFKFLNVGKKEEAVKEFKILAKTEGPDGENVKQLLYIWGAIPEKQETAWIEHRARNAPGNELAGWWRHLDEIGAGNRVVAMASDMRVSLHPDAEAQLMNALISTGDKVAIDTYLRGQANKTLKPPRLEKLAEYARDANIGSTAAYIWHRLVEKDPGNKKANNALGMMAFSEGNLQDAELYLKRCIDKANGDWESTFFLGEAMHANGRKKASLVYFERSLLQTEQIASQNKQVRRTRAVIFYRLTRSAEAIREFDSLIEDFPADKQLRAEYSTFLIEQGQLDKARRLLASS